MLVQFAGAGPVFETKVPSNMLPVGQTPLNELPRSALPRPDRAHGFLPTRGVLAGALDDVDGVARAVGDGLDRLGLVVGHGHVRALPAVGGVRLGVGLARAGERPVEALPHAGTPVAGDGAVVDRRAQAGRCVDRERAAGQRLHISGPARLAEERGAESIPMRLVAMSRFFRRLQRRPCCRPRHIELIAGGEGAAR